MSDRDLYKAQGRAVDAERENDALRTRLLALAERWERERAPSEFTKFGPDHCRLVLQMTAELREELGK